jgi:hypothetical protein
MNDFTQMVTFYNTEFEDQTEDAFASMPAASGAGPTNCGNYHCTGNNNIVMRFEGTTFTGDTVPTAPTDANFQVVATA